MKYLTIRQIENGYIVSKVLESECWSEHNEEQYLAGNVPAVLNLVKNILEKDNEGGVTND